LLVVPVRAVIGCWYLMYELLVDCKVETEGKFGYFHFP